MVAVAVAIIFGVIGGAVAGLVLTLDRGDDETTVAEPIDPLTSALMDYIVDTSVGTVTAEDAACMTERIIDTVGRDALVQAGIDRGADPLVALTDDQIQTGLPPAMDCLDDATAASLMKATLSPSVLASLNLSNGDCLVDGWMAGLGRDRLVELYALWARRLNADLATVLTPAEMDQVLGVVAECSQAPASATSTSAPSATGTD